MGVDTKAIIRKGTTLEEIKQVIEKHYSGVKVHETSSKYFVQIVFKDEGDNRMLSIFFNEYAKTDYGIDGVLLSLGCSGNSVQIMNHLLNEFGGFIDENDCDDKEFCPVNIELFKQTKELTDDDELMLALISKIGYVNAEKAFKILKDNKI